MTAKDILLKLDSKGVGNFEIVAGLRARRIAFNRETVDITDSDSAGRWRELLAGSGVQRASISGSGIFKDASSDAAIRAAFFDGDILAWQVVIPDFGTVSGAFQITVLEYSGNHGGEVIFAVALESAGRLEFEPQRPTKEDWKPARAAVEAIEKERAALLKPTNGRYMAARDRLDAIEAALPEIIGRCEGCEEPIFDGERYSYDSINAIHLCEECSPSYADMLADPTSFYNNDEEYLTPEQAKDICDAHVAKGGSLDDKMVSA